jgi:hypothetical protein
VRLAGNKKAALPRVTLTKSYYAVQLSLGVSIRNFPPKVLYGFQRLRPSQIVDKMAMEAAITVFHGPILCLIYRIAKPLI